MFWLLEIGVSWPERNLMFWANEERNCLFLVFGFILSRAIRNVPSFRFSWKKLVNNQLGCWSNCKNRIWLLYWYFYQLCASKDRFFFHCIIHCLAEKFYQIHRINETSGLLDCVAFFMFALFTTLTGRVSKFSSESCT